MLKRKKMLIDKKFQLKTAFSIMGISTISFIIILIFIGSKAYRNNRDIRSTINSLYRAVETEDNIIKAFVDFSSSFTGKTIRLAVSNITRDHAQSIATMKQYIYYLENIVIEYFSIIIVIIVVVVLQTVFYYVYLIRFTHRISGPIYVINNFVQDLIDGKKPVQRELREKDEFKELYEKLKLLSDKMQAKEKRQAARKKPKNQAGSGTSKA